MNDLFLEADKELANEYESDFEQEKEINNKKSSPSNKNDENSTSVLSILQKSAVQVEKEEKKKLDELFSDAKDEILAILDNNNSNNKFNNDVNALLEIESSERKYSIQNNDSKEEKVSREVILVGKEEKQKEESKDGEDDGNLYKDDPKYIRNIKNENFKLNKGKNKILLISSTKSNLKPFVKELLYNSENGDEENGIDLEYQDRHGWTALHWACRHNNLDIIKLFYTYYTKKVNKDFQILCNIKEETCGWTPLHVAAVCCNKEAVLYLIHRGARRGEVDFFNDVPYNVIGKGKNMNVIKKILSPLTKREDILLELTKTNED